MWKQITLDVPDDLKDAVVGELSEEGVAGVWENASPSPGLTGLTLYFNSNSDLRSIERRICDVFDRSSCARPKISRTIVEARDWTEEWKKSYTSFPIGNDFFVIPSWVNDPCPDDRLPIRIDPGQAFGTGTHETTQLTIEVLERWVEPYQVVLDLGTGSGILALASRLLGAHEVIACDIDPIAVHVATANIQLNDEADIWTFCGSVDCVVDNSVHLLLANLTADVIIDLFPEINRVLHSSGIAIFSGILNEQREDIEEICERFHFPIHEQIARGEWLTLVTEKHGA
jgi:ribosomal protein L11 methyltransferase